MGSKPLYCTYIFFNNENTLTLTTESLEMHNHIFSIINQGIIKPEAYSGNFIVIPDPSKKKGTEKYIIINKMNINYIQFMERSI